MITPGDVDDRKPLEYKSFLDFIYGKLVGDKGYISKNLFQRLFVDGIQLITKLKSNMNGALMSVSDRLLLSKRTIIETVNDELKNIAQVGHSRHRCFDNFIVNLLGAIVAYCLFPKKPCINVQRTIDTQLILFSIQPTHVILGYLGGAEPTNALIVLSCYDLYDVSHAMLIERSVSKRYGMLTTAGIGSLFIMNEQYYAPRSVIMIVMQWTDRIRQVKIFLVVAAILIAVASLVASNILTKDLAQQERTRMEVWAEAMRMLSKADDNTDLALVLKVLNGNNTIPVVVIDSSNSVTDFRNVRIRGKNYEDSIRQVTAMAKRLQASGQSIRIPLSANGNDYIDVCYDDSLMLRRLALYPYVQLGVVMLFVVVAIFALLTSKRAEQNKVWVGLSKETAHQLGTPISSLMAWTTILKESYPDDKLLPEMDKDVRRLQLIADRFSKIGSLPEPVPASLNEVLDHVIDYMDRRTSKKVVMQKEFPDNDVIVKMNASLFEWVIENLCKNAVDAMGGESGQITLHVEETDNKAIIEVSDTGKGIKKKDIGNVFRPGFTTKKRGWGLGLSLAKRIVEEYHRGRIFVKSSAIGKGTTFRIELSKQQ